MKRTLVMITLVMLAGTAVKASAQAWELTVSPDVFCPRGDSTTTVAVHSVFACSLSVYVRDEQGVQQAKLYSAPITPGDYVITWDGHGMQMGGYTVVADAVDELGIIYLTDAEPVTLSCLSPVAPKSWGGIKALYR